MSSIPAGRGVWCDQPSDVTIAGPNLGCQSFWSCKNAPTESACLTKNRFVCFLTTFAMGASEVMPRRRASLGARPISRWLCCCNLVFETMPAPSLLPSSNRQWHASITVKNKVSASSSNCLARSYQLSSLASAWITVDAQWATCTQNLLLHPQCPNVKRFRLEIFFAEVLVESPSGDLLGFMQCTLLLL